MPALIDSGVSVTAVDGNVLDRLGYPPYGAINLATAGGMVTTPMYLVRLVLFSNVPGVRVRIVLDNVPVAAVDLSARQYRVLVCRDILRSVLLIYDGTMSQITVTYWVDLMRLVPCFTVAWTGGVVLGCEISRLDGWVVPW